jgi:uncharacterized repeat protein (TIGR02543 family)
MSPDGRVAIGGIMRRKLVLLSAVAAVAVIGSAIAPVSASGGGTALSAPLAIGDLQTALSPCNGTSAAPTAVTLTGNVDAPSSELIVDCYAVLNLAGHALNVRNVIINTGKALTIDDTPDTGTLTADASSEASLAGIQNTGAALIVNAGTVTATGGEGGAGIGGRDEAHGGTTTVNGGTVEATGGFSAAGIGGGIFGNGGTTTVNGGEVTATGGVFAAGIGGGGEGAGGTTTVTGGEVTATGGNFGAGIGGGDAGSGGTTTVTEGEVTATGGDYAAGIGGGGDGSYAGGDGGVTAVAGGVVNAVGGTDGSAVGPGRNADAAFGSLSVTGGVLRLPSGDLRVPDSNSGVDGAEITVGVNGTIAGSAEETPTYATVTGAGQIDNGGWILLPAANVGVDVFDRHFEVDFDTQGGSSAPAAVTLFADTFTNGGRPFPADPTRAGFGFDGWNTAANGTGTTVTATSVLPGESTTGAAVSITVYAQWVPATNTAQPLSYWKSATLASPPLPITLGTYNVNTQTKARAVFKATNCGVKTGDAVGCLAGQLLVAKLNIAAEVASDCITATAANADTFLTAPPTGTVSYTGPGTYTLTKTQRKTALTMANSLATFNTSGCP